MRLSPAAKVAAGATAVIAVIYVLAVIVLNAVVATHLTEQNDDRLTGRVAAARHDPAVVGRRVTDSGAVPDGADLDNDDDGTPVFLWALSAGGTVTAHTPGAPALPGWPAPRVRVTRRAREHRDARPGRAVPAGRGA